MSEAKEKKAVKSSASLQSSKSVKKSKPATPKSQPRSRPGSPPIQRPPNPAISRGQGQIMKQEISGYLKYLGVVKELEKGDGKIRTVFLFLQPGDNSLNSVIDTAESEWAATGILVIVRVPPADWKEFQVDKKFKVHSMPWASVFNRKLSLGRDTIHKSLGGEQIYDARRFAYLFK